MGKKKNSKSQADASQNIKGKPKFIVEDVLQTNHDVSEDAYYAVAARGMSKDLPSQISNSVLHAAKISNVANVPFTAPFDAQRLGVQLSQAETLFKNNRWYLISNFQQLLAETYVENGLVQTIVDVPVNDALRGGIVIKTSQFSPEEIEQIQTDMEHNEDLEITGEAGKWTRLFGGGAIIIITDQDYKTPLDVNAIGPGTVLEFKAVDLWELYDPSYATEDMSIEARTTGMPYYQYYGESIHKSRVIKLRGRRAPSFIRPRLRGWGMSVVETLVRSINSYLKSQNLVFEVLDEFKLDIFKVFDLATTLMDECGEATVAKRISVMNGQKNYLNSIVMDSQDDYVQKQLSFAGIAEIMKELRMQVASDMRFPITKLFGVSASGFNSGEDDIENYNSMVEGEVRAKLKYPIAMQVKLRFQHRFGRIPDDLIVEFKPLRIMSSEQEETIKTQKFQRALSARQGGEITTEEFRDACNIDSLLPVQLKQSNILELEEEQDDQESDDEGEESQDVSASEGDKSQTEAKEAKESKEAKQAKNSNKYNIRKRVA